MRVRPLDITPHATRNTSALTILGFDADPAEVGAGVPLLRESRLEASPTELLEADHSDHSRPAPAPAAAPIDDGSGGANECEWGRSPATCPSPLGLPLALPAACQGVVKTND